MAKGLLFIFQVDCFFFFLLAINHHCNLNYSLSNEEINPNGLANDTQHKVDDNKEANGTLY